MAHCYVALGSNQGDRQQMLLEALRLLPAAGQIHLLRASRFYETQPVGGPAHQPPYLNAAAQLQTALSPSSLLRRFQEVERRLGRQRRGRWEARTIDLDLLLFEDRVIHQPDLQVPHPRMHVRKFVLVPLAEIAPDLRHPALGWTVRQLLEWLQRRPCYLALSGPLIRDSTVLAHQLAQRTEGELVGDSCFAPMLHDLLAAPSRLALERQLQWLQRSVAALDDRRWTDAEHRWLISDYWCDELWVVAQASLTGPPRERFRRTWLQARERVLKPTLVVWLDVLVGLESAHPRDPANSQPVAERERLDGAYREYVSFQHRTPLLHLDTDNLAQATTEVLAAMQAATG